MELWEALARLIDTKQRELKTYAENKAHAEHMIAEIQRGLPTLEAALQVLSNGFMGRVPVDADSPMLPPPPTLVNPFREGTLGHEVYVVLAKTGYQMHSKKILQQVEARLGNQISPSSIENVLYREVQVFEKVAPGVFTLRKDA